MGLILITFWLSSYFPKMWHFTETRQCQGPAYNNNKRGKSKLNIRKQKTISLSTVFLKSEIFCVCPYSPYEALAIRFPGGCMSTWAQGEWVEDSLGRHLFLQYPSSLYSGHWKGGFIHTTTVIRDKGEDYAIANNYQIQSPGWVKTGQVSKHQQRPKMFIIWVGTHRHPRGTVGNYEQRNSRNGWLSVEDWVLSA